MRGVGPLAMLAVFTVSCEGGGNDAAPTVESSPESQIGQPSVPGPSSQTHLRQSLSLYGQGDFQASLQEAKNALAASPAAPEPYRLVSKIYTDIGRDRDGIEFFKEAARNYPSQSEPWFYKGFHEFRRHKWKEALESFERAAGLDPENPECHARQGLIHQYMGEFERALLEFKRAHELSPASASHAVRLVTLLRISGSYDEAEKILSEALAATPDSADLHYALGQLRLRHESNEEAETALRRAIALHPALAKAHKDLAGVLFRKGQEQEAQLELAIAERLTDYVRRKSFLVERLGLNPGNPLLPLLLGELELTEQRFSRALGWFTRARALGAPANRIAAGRAEAYTGLGKVAAGEAELSTLPQTGDGRADLARAALLMARGNIPEAAMLLDRAVARGPEEREFLRRASDLYARIGRNAESYALLERAVSVARVPTP